ncbi:MAG: DUF493 family protein [Lutibacter sp.]
MDKKEAFYIKLKSELEETTKFPTRYMYKFIIPASDEKVKQVEEIFNHMGAVINKKASKTGKFYSISVVVKLKNADEVIQKYREAEKVEGIISL